jgi:hypothetical protein
VSRINRICDIPLGQRLYETAGDDAAHSTALDHHRKMVGIGAPAAFRCRFRAIGNQPPDRWGALVVNLVFQRNASVVSEK